MSTAKVNTILPVTGDGVNFNGFFPGVFTAGGTADALTVTLAPALTEWVTGVQFMFRPSAANTGSATINANGIGAVTLKLPDASTNLPAGYLQTSNVYGVWYDGTNAVIVSAPSIIESGNGTNGYYVRYADGTQICTHKDTTARTTSGSAGNIFVSGEQSWTYPKAFSATPQLSGNIYETNSNAFTVRMGATIPPNATSTPYRVVGVANTDTGKSDLIAIGRWY